MWTRDGETWRPGGDEGVCQHWQKDVSGAHHDLSDGDILSMYLCDDKSVSITYNNAEVPNVFRMLPDKPLWVVVLMGVNKLEVIQTGEDEYFY